MRKLHTFEFPSDIEAHLRTFAKQTGATKSAIVREAVSEYLKRHASPVVSAYDLTSDLAGAIKGPKDLSSNSIHMADYGSSDSDLDRHRPPRRLSQPKR